MSEPLRLSRTGVHVQCLVKQGPVDEFKYVEPDASWTCGPVTRAMVVVQLFHSIGKSGKEEVESQAE